MKSILFLVPVMFTTLFGISTMEVVENVQSRLNGFKNSDSIAVLSIYDARNNKSEKKFVAKMAEEKKVTKIYLEFLAPTDVAGVKILSYQYANKSKKQWIYMPSIGKTREIKGKAAGGSILGSDIEFEDLDLLASSDVAYNDKPVITQNEYTIESYPESGSYTKLIYKIDSKTNQVKLIEYYDKKSALVKIGRFENYKVIKGINRVQRITVENLVKKTKSVLEWEKDELFATISEKVFDPYNLDE